MEAQPTSTGYRVRCTARHLRLARYISERLEERGRPAHDHLVRLLRHLDEERVLALLHQALELSEMPTWTAGGRSRGEIFFHLVRKRLTLAEQQRIFPYSRRMDAHRTGDDHLASRAAGDAEGAAWPSLPEDQRDGDPESLSSRAVRPQRCVTVIGWPERAAERDGVMVLELKRLYLPPRASLGHDRKPTVFTDCIALIDQILWGAVSGGLAHHPKALLIVEGHAAEQSRRSLLVIQCTYAAVMHLPEGE